MNQVHKENLTHVENAIPGRQGLEIEIFGMEGVPADHIEQHNQATTQKHFAEEAERARLTGNPVRGQYTNGTAPPNKRKRVVETLEEIETHAEQWERDRKNGVPRPTAMEVVESVLTPDLCPLTLSANSPKQSQATPYHPQQISPHPTNGGSIPPPRPASIPGQPGALPPRPTAVDPIQSSIDDLIAGVAKEAPDKKEKSKKDKNMRLIFNDESISPEEKMARLPRYAQHVRV
jgi:hypothetical protein